MAPMDVEKRMNLSLDAIIKQNTGKGKAGRGKPQAAKRRGKASAEKAPAKKKPTGKAQARKQDIGQRVSKGLGVQKKGLKVQKSGKKVAIAAQPRRGAKGRRGPPARVAVNPKRSEPEARSRGRGSIRPSRDASTKRTVDLPRLTDLRITISNEKAAASGYPIASMGAPGFQPSAYQSQPMWAAPSHVMQQPLYGYGPRNLAPRDAYNRMAPDIPTRVVPEFPVPRPRMEYGLPRKAAGAEPYVPRRAYKDFDDPNQNKSYMRMDNR